MTDEKQIRVAVNGYGVIGKRVADAVVAQEDMDLVGVADVTADWRARMARAKGFALYAADPDRTPAMREAGLDVLVKVGKHLRQQLAGLAHEGQLLRVLQFDLRHGLPALCPPRQA